MNKLVVCAGLVSAGIASADIQPQVLPLAQPWTNAALVTTNDDWSSVPGIIGYRGDGLVTAAGVDPQTVVADGAATPVDVNANQTSGSFGTGGVSEFELPDPTIGLKGSGTARAPHLVLAVFTFGEPAVRVRYTVRDLDGGPNDAVMQVALQYRVGSSGPFTNVAAGHVADATTGPNTTGPAIPVDVVLPAAAGNQFMVEIRILVTDALGTDEYVGIDSITVSSASAPPAVCGDGEIGGTETCDDDDTDAGDGCSATCRVESGWSCAGAPSVCTDNDECALGTADCDVNATCTNAPGTFSCACNAGYVGDGETCASVCGDGLVVGTEECDDEDLEPADGCNEACLLEPGYTCTGMPSICTGELACGDGAIGDSEGCDDGNVASGDGCGDDCEIEDDFTCEGEPSECILDPDGDGVGAATDNCPRVANPQQADADRDGVGDACELTNPASEDEGGGCCQVGGDPTAVVLAFATLLGLRRRVRS